uniref:AAA ATPase n=1 Tax=Cyanothece sp. (strain PCC 7425 / ATCC 29141) TaxID=395961 RepID=B8HXB9_CYAP4
MQPQISFPKELLLQPIPDRIAYFKDYTMAHPKLIEADRKLMHAIREPGGAALIFVFGPTGVGKSTLLKRITQKLLKEALSLMETDKGYIPIAGVEIKTPEDSNFDWNDFYVRALMALNEPMIEKKINRTGAKLKLRLALESALRNRRPDAFYIDEAQNFGKVASGRKLQDQTDCIKSLANLAQTRFILCGIYELLPLRNLSGQLCRRSHSIHFPRYSADSEQDLKAFKSALLTLQNQLPLPEPPDLVAHWEFCYERTIGCIGILKDLLLRTLSAILVRDGDKVLTLKPKDLEQRAWSLEECLVMLREAKEGEQQLTDKSGLHEELRTALGFNAATSKQSAKSSKSTSSKKAGSVGKPSPRRRSVGIDQDAS